MKTRNRFWLFVLAFFVFLIMSTILNSSILVCINYFIKVPSKLWILCCIGISVIFSFAMSALIVGGKKQIGESKFSFWVKKNYPKLLIVYSLLVLALVSVKSQPIWSAEAVYDVLSLQWTIFGLSLTIFLVWDVVMVDFLKKDQPKECSSTDMLQKYESILEKRSFSQNVETTFSTIIILTINLFLLLVSTTLIYINNTPDTVFTQNVLHCSYFFTTNSIACLFLDILKPLKREKAEMLDKSNVSKSDIDNAQAAVLVQAIFDGMKKGLAEWDSNMYSEEEKKQILIQLMEGFIDAVRNKDNSSPEKQQNSSINHKLLS